MVATKEAIDALERQLLNATGDVPLHSRFRALFTLKSLKSEAAIAAIAKGYPLCHVISRSEV
jgi:deoxyhypusine monooxygenase